MECQDLHFSGFTYPSQYNEDLRDFLLSKRTDKVEDIRRTKGAECRRRRKKFRSSRRGSLEGQREKGRETRHGDISVK